MVNNLLLRCVWYARVMRERDCGEREWEERACFSRLEHARFIEERINFMGPTHFSFLFPYAKKVEKVTKHYANSKTILHSLCIFL
jgi:hypothetical protein